jgi:quercetin dioxygenase-like cupin family protein
MPIIGRVSLTIPLVALLLSHSAAQTPSAEPPPGITRTQLLDNQTVMMARLQMAPGAREQLHTHPFSAVIVQVEPGLVEMRLGTRGETTRRDAGHVDFIAADMPHAAANAGGLPFTLVTIAIKPDRVPGGGQAPSEAPPGITRAPVLENTEARATRVRFERGAREPVHTHPYDLVLVQLTPGTMEIETRGVRSVRDYKPGDAVFLPRDVPHAAANVDDRAFEIVSVGIK